MRVPLKSFWLFVLVAAMLVLSGCINSADKFYGSGPLTLSNSAQQAFDKYLSYSEPLAFAITTDGGGYYYRFCREYQCIFENSARSVIDGCEERTGRQCKLYANGKQIVWRFSGQQIAQSILSDSTVCVGAIQSNRPRWDSGLKYRTQVSEAKRRGLSEQQCARLSGRFTEQQIAAVHGLALNSNVSPAIRSRADGLICQYAIENHPGNLLRVRWSNTPRFSEDVAEAKRRGLSERQCARLMGWTIEQQIAAVRRNQNSGVRTSANPKDINSDQMICRQAILHDMPKWESTDQFMAEVEKAKRRGFTEQQCARLTGRYSEQQIAAGHRGKPPPRTSVARRSNLRTLADQQICHWAIQSNSPKWELAGGLQSRVAEAKRRGFTEQHCARLTGRIFEQQIIAAIDLNSDKMVCHQAIQHVNPKWETQVHFRADVEKAKRRGFDELRCARLTGRFTEQRIAKFVSASVATSSKLYLTDFNVSSSKNLCRNAIKLNVPRWDFEIRTPVNKAKRLGLTEWQCARLTERFTEQQITAVHGYRPKIGEQRVAQSAPDKSTINQAQRLLIDLKFLTGRADGVAGPKTKAAVKTFERSQQLPPTGSIDDKLIAKLKEAQLVKVAQSRLNEAKTVAQLREEIAKLKKRAELVASRQEPNTTKQPVRSTANFGNYHALVIGINSYQNLPHLRTAVADAEAIADVLKTKYGFEVSALINPTREQIFNKLDSLRANLTPNAQYPT